jgi:hypothetical protein
MVFEEFLQTLNAKMASKNRNILLFMDNCAAHPKNVAHLSNVHVEFIITMLMFIPFGALE